MNKVFIFHLFYSLIEGALAGALLMNEFVYIKKLKCDNEQLALLFQVSLIILIVGLWMNQLLQRVKNKRLLLIVTALLTRGPLFLMALFPHDANAYTNKSWQIIFLCIFFLYYCANPIIYPIINLLLKNNYSHHDFGKYYSYATTAKKIMAVISVFVFGQLLEMFPYCFTTLYPVMAIFGILSVVLLTFIPMQHIVLPTFSKKGGMIKEMLKTLKVNKGFRNFEVGFMLYGFAFMLTASVITIFFEKVLFLSDSTVSFYKSYYNIIAIVLLPFCGKIISKVSLAKFAIYTYTSLLGYILFIMLAEYMPQYFTVFNVKIYPMLLISFSSFGIFTAMMALLWSIGSAYFCEKEETAYYQSIHMTLTGARAMFAPLLGVFLIPYLSYTGVFTMAIISLAIAVIFLKVKEKESPTVKI